MPSFRTTAQQFALAALAVLLCLWAATQWAATMLAYQAALGAPWIDLPGLKLYAPWQLLARNRVGMVRCPSLKTLISNSPSRKVWLVGEEATGRWR